MPRDIAWRRPMQQRDVHEDHRASTPLELLVDLSFVVGISQVATSLHHALSEGHVGVAVLAYPTTFFSIWWAWVNFTWFASSYDTDDVPFRLATLLQIAGVLVIAAGVPRAFNDHDFKISTVGYLITRIGLISQWWRVSRNRESRVTARRYAIGLAICQAGWFLLLLFPTPVRSWGFLVLVLAELSVPIIAERDTPTSWHPGHIAERYGLFTLIVLGESILAATVAVQEGIDAGKHVADLILISVGGLLVVFCMWWMYFDHDAEAMFEEAIGDDGDTARAHRIAFEWGYGHFVVFGSAAAVGAGLSVAVDHVLDAGEGGLAGNHGELSDLGVGFAVTIPIAMFVIAMFVLHRKSRHIRSPRGWALPVTALAVLATSFTGEPVLFSGLLLAAVQTVAIVNGWTRIGRASADAEVGIAG
ncbi:MAG: low temperature requirement protein A [Ilumatobacteraceae bacterium]